MAKDENSRKRLHTKDGHPPAKPLKKAVSRFSSVSAVADAAHNVPWARQIKVEKGPARIRGDVTAKMAALASPYLMVPPALLFRRGSAPVPSTPSSDERVKRKCGPGRPRKHVTSSSLFASTTSPLGGVKRGRGLPRKDGTSTSRAFTTPIMPTNPPTNQPKHPSGIMASPLPPTASKPARFSSRLQKLLQAKQHTERNPTETPESPSAPPPRAESTPVPTPIPTCNEVPHLMTSDDNFLSALMTLDDAPPIQHSPSAKPCANAAAHPDGPHYICWNCHVYKHGSIHRNYPQLVTQNKCFPLCQRCGISVLNTRPMVQGPNGTYMTPTGCRCGAVDIKCFQCQVAELELRDAKATGEREYLSGTIGVGSADVGVTRTVSLGLKCLCGNHLMGGETVAKCVGCDGLSLKP